ncbi:Protein RTM1 [Paramyrothecium foliicola]|nr:Protein RTM1 [Paramyrothecium foliicola]
MARLKPLDGIEPPVYIWSYVPSVPAAAIFLTLFTVATASMTWRTTRTRCWFCIAFIIGGWCRFCPSIVPDHSTGNRLLKLNSQKENLQSISVQIIGYAARIAAHYHTNHLAPFVIQSSLIVLAPVFYAASIYMVLGRLIRSVHGERLSLVSTRWLTKIFIAGDCLALMLQGNAVGLTIRVETQKTGEIILITGLFAQLVVFGFFIVVAALFQRRMNQDGMKETQGRPNIPWEQGLRMLYGCSALIAVRSIFRVVEYIGGTEGYLLSNEWPLYVFDAALMWAVQVIFTFWFPDKFVVVPAERFDDRHELEMRQPGANAS